MIGRGWLISVGKESIEFSCQQNWVFNYNLSSHKTVRSVSSLTTFYIKLASVEVFIKWPHISDMNHSKQANLIC